MTLICRELRLRNYRNFGALDLAFPEAGVAIIGDNGSGKTNLLESIHYLEILRSFRGAADEQLVRFGGEAFHVRGMFEDAATGRTLEVTAAYEPRTRRKRVTIDGAEVERLGDAIGRLGTIIFSPSDVELVSGSPAERRRFLDIVLSLNVRGYLDALQRYRQVLRQRNAVLRAGRGTSSLEAWNAALVESGAVVVEARGAWIAAQAERYASLYRTISGGIDGAMEYDADIVAEQGAGRAEIAAAFGARLERVASRELDRGLSLAGPHRDDISLTMMGSSGAVDLRHYGSGGQVRTAAIALRMVEADTVRDSRGFQPLLLLDDVFAELDPGRSRRILELFPRDRHGQVILTAPKDSDVLLEEGGAGALMRPLARWRIAAGQVTG